MEILAVIGLLLLLRGLANRGGNGNGGSGGGGGEDIPAAVPTGRTIIDPRTGAASRFDGGMQYSLTLDPRHKHDPEFIELDGSLFNLTDEPITLDAAMGSVQSAAHLMNLAIFDTTILQFGASTPTWFRDLALNLMTSGAAQPAIEIYNIINSKPASFAEVNVLDMLRKVDPVYLYESRDNQPPFVSFVFNPRFSSGWRWRWKPRNMLGEEVASGVYFAASWIETRGGVLQSGWLKFLYIK